MDVLLSETNFYLIYIFLFFILSKKKTKKQNRFTSVNLSL